MKASLVVTVSLVSVLTAAGSSLALIEAIGEAGAFAEAGAELAQQTVSVTEAEVQSKAGTVVDTFVPEAAGSQVAFILASADSTTAFVDQIAADVQTKGDATVVLATFLTSNVASQGNLAVAVVAAIAQDAAGSDAAAPARAVLEDLAAQDPAGTFFATGAAALQGAADIAGSNELSQAAALFAGILSAAQECDYAGSDAFFGGAGLPATWTALRAWCQGFQDELVDL